MNYKIPEGAKEISVTETEGKIVVEFVNVLQPKRGDVCINKLGSVYVFKEDDGDGFHEIHVGKATEEEHINAHGCYLAGRLATNEEAQPLFDALEKEGKRWNPETLQVEDIHRFKEGDVVCKDGRIIIVKTYPCSYHVLHRPCNDALHILGGYGVRFTDPDFRLATEEEKQQLFSALKKEGKKWNPEKMCVEEITERERILKFLQEKHVDGLWRNHGDIANIIEYYLEEREGK